MQIVKNENLLIAVFVPDHKLEDVSMDISTETRLCREAGEGYAEISVPFNTLDRFVGGSGPLLNRPRLGASDQASHRASSGVLMHSNAFSYLRQVTISYHFISFHTISYHFIGHFILFHTSFHRFCRGSLTPPG